MIKSRSATGIFLRWLNSTSVGIDLSRKCVDPRAVFPRIPSWLETWEFAPFQDLFPDFRENLQSALFQDFFLTWERICDSFLTLGPYVLDRIPSWFQREFYKVHSTAQCKQEILTLAPFTFSCFQLEWVHSWALFFAATSIFMRSRDTKVSLSLSSQDTKVLMSQDTKVSS